MDKLQSKAVEDLRIANTSLRGDVTALRAAFDFEVRALKETLAQARRTNARALAMIATNRVRVKALREERDTLADERDRLVAVNVHMRKEAKNLAERAANLTVELQKMRILVEAMKEQIEKLSHGGE